MRVPNGEQTLNINLQIGLFRPCQWPVHLLVPYPFLPLPQRSRPFLPLSVVKGITQPGLQQKILQPLLAPLHKARCIFCVQPGHLFPFAPDVNPPRRYATILLNLCRVFQRAGGSTTTKTSPVRTIRRIYVLWDRSLAFISDRVCRPLILVVVTLPLS
jgi:hypothetical protein